MPPVRRPGGRGGTRSGNRRNEHHEEERQEGEGEQGNNANQDVLGALLPVLQEILTRMGPRVEERQHDQEHEEGSHHGESHRSEHREEEHERERERSRTPPGGRRHHRGGRDRDSEDSIRLDIMKALQSSRPPPFDGKGSGLKAETWLLDMERCFTMYPYSTNMRARCAIMQLRDHGSIWWNTESKKLQINVADLTWEIFEERF
jgi:hypothetical protein